MDVQELIQALLDNVVGRAASAKKGQANLLLACKAFGAECVMDALLVCAQHKAKQKAVPALESVNVLITSFGLKSHSTNAPKVSAGRLPHVVVADSAAARLRT